MMNHCNEDLDQIDEGDFLRNEVSDEALEAAASVATGGLPTLWYSTASGALLGRRSATKLLSEDEARRIPANVAKLPNLLCKGT